MLKTRLRILFIKDSSQSYALTGLKIFDKVSEWPNKTWIKFRRTTAASVSKMMVVGEGSQRLIQGLFMRRNLDLSFQERSKYFRHSVSKILLQGKGFWRKNPEGGSKDQKIQMKFYGKNFETEKTQMWAMVHINNDYLLMSVSRFLHFWLLLSKQLFLKRWNLNIKTSTITAKGVLCIPRPKVLL